MADRDLREKREEIRRDIKRRMQQKLDQKKKEIKAHIKKEKISVHEKRQKYHREVHEQKQLLMNQAKDEFRARKRMLGIPPDSPEDARPEAHAAAPIEQEVNVAHPPEKELSIQHNGDFIPPEEAFIYEDNDDSDLRELQRPISASDALPVGLKPEHAGTGPAGAREIAFEEEESKNLFYYMINIVIRPVQALDEFDDYLADSYGLAKVLLFYLVSLLPIVLFVFIGEEIVSRMPQGLLWKVIGANLLADANILMILARTVGGLLLYTGTIVIVNYYATDDANFLTLLIYFAFVEAVTRVIIYSLVILTVFSAIMAAVVPQVLLMVALLFLAFFIWRVCLNIIVLMSAYGYHWYSAVFLAVGASYVPDIFRYILIRHVFGGQVF